MKFIKTGSVKDLNFNLKKLYLKKINELFRISEAFLRIDDQLLFKYFYLKKHPYRLYPIHDSQ